MFPCVKGKGRSKNKSSYWGATTQVMAPAIGQLALNNGSYGSISKDWVALPPQNTQLLCCLAYSINKKLDPPNITTAVLGSPK